MTEAEHDSKNSADQISDLSQLILSATAFSEASNDTSAIELLYQGLDQHEELRIPLAQALTRLGRVHEVANLFSASDLQRNPVLLNALIRAHLANRDFDLASTALDILKSRFPQNPAISNHETRLNGARAEIGAPDIKIDKNASRIVALLSTSFSGTTMLGVIIGSLKGVESVSESFSMIRYDQFKFPGNKDAFDFEKANRKDIQACDSCGTECSMFPFEFRRELSKDPTNWFFKLRDKASAQILLSSDKNMARTLDPLQRYGAIVMFRPAYDVFMSYRKRNHVYSSADPREAMTVFLRNWQRFYRRMLYEDKPEGPVVWLDWHKFCSKPHEHLERLCSVFDIEFDETALKERRVKQHIFFGNKALLSGLKKDQKKTIDVKYHHADPSLRPLFDELTKENQDFSDLCQKLDHKYQSSFFRGRESC